MSYNVGKDLILKSEIINDDLESMIGLNNTTS